MQSPRAGVALVLLTTPAAAAIPHFARRYEVACSRCHLLPPKLNESGEALRQRGYRMPDERRGRSTIPLAVWVSGRSDAYPSEPRVRDAVRGYLNRVEVISGGQLVAPWLSYFVEWRPASPETRSRDGEVGLRDRSGSFEDLMVTASAGNLALTLGQYRLIDQVDISLRLGLSEPLPLAASIPGRVEGPERLRSLRSFCSGRPLTRRPARLAAAVGSGVGLDHLGRDSAARRVLDSPDPRSAHRGEQRAGMEREGGHGGVVRAARAVDGGRARLL